MAKTVGLKDVLLPWNRTVNEEIFKIISLKNRVLQIEVSSFEDIQSIARKVSRCFGDCSIFTALKAVRFQFNDVQISVRRENSEPQAIVQQYASKLREKEEKMKKEEQHKAYLHIRHLHDTYHGKKLQEMIYEASEKEEFLFKDKEAEKEWFNLKEKAKIDTTLSETIYFAEYWAKYMQFLQKKHPNADISDFAECAMLNFDGLEIPMLYATEAIPMLINYWKYGNKLYVLY